MKHLFALALLVAGSSAFAKATDTPACPAPPPPPGRQAALEILDEVASAKATPAPCPPPVAPQPPPAKHD